MKKVILLLCLSLVLLPFSVDAKEKKAMKEEYSRVVFTEASPEDAERFEQGAVEIASVDARSHDQKEMKIIKDNPEGFSTATGKIYTDEEMRKLKQQVAPYIEESSVEPSTSGDFHMETVFGLDDREQITNTTVFPYRSVVKLYYQKSDGKTYYCTGAIIDDDSILTAAHCLYENQINRYVSAVEVVPGKNGTSEPYGRYNATDLMVTNAWASKEYTPEGLMTDDMIAVDYGIVKVPAGTFSASHGYFKLKSDGTEGMQINITGYPKDKGENYMYRALGNIYTIYTYGNDQMYDHQVDIEVGESGGPNFNSPDGTNFYIVGIQSAENPQWNKSCKITPVSITNINVWK